ncbi:MAG: AAA family ATPase, partial [Myxococcota bacterium]
MVPRLRSLHVCGLRSLRDVTLALHPETTVLAGANGAGKSNVLGAVRLVSHLATQGLRAHVAKAGGASRVLHYGPQVTRELELELVFEQERGTNHYAARLAWAAGDQLVFVDERVGHDSSTGIRWTELGVGHLESRVPDAATSGDITARSVQYCLRRLTYYHFHDTAPEAPLRT